MPHTHVCLVSEQPIPNLTTVLQFKPDKVVLLTTKEMRRQTARLGKIISSKKIKVDVRDILPYDVNNVAAVCGQIIDECADCDVSLNITGGTKISTLGAYQEFYTREKPIYYVNTRDEKILQIAPKETKASIEVVIPISEYLAAYGFNIEKHVKNVEVMYKRKAATDALVDLAIDKPWLIGSLNGAFPSDIENAQYPLEIPLADNELRTVFAVISKVLPVQSAGGRSYMIAEQDTARYLRGIWLEEHVYLTAKELGASEVKMGVEGKWEAPGKHTPKNEFDVLIAKGVRLFMVSCKTSNPNRKKHEEDKEAISKEYLYELDSLSDRALGLFGKRMLISARPITDEYVKKRAEVLDISIIDGKNLRSLKENFRQWLSK